MTEYTDDPEAIMEYMNARDRTKNWVVSHSQAVASGAFYSPSVAPSVRTHESNSSDPDWDAESSKSIPPRMELKYGDGRVIKIGPDMDRYQDDRERRRERETRRRDREEREYQRREQDNARRAYTGYEYGHPYGDPQGTRSGHATPRTPISPVSPYEDPYAYQQDRHSHGRRSRTRSHGHSIADSRASMPPIPVPPPHPHTPYSNASPYTSGPSSPYGVSPQHGPGSSPYKSFHEQPPRPDQPFIPHMEGQHGQPYAMPAQQPSPIHPSQSQPQTPLNISGPETIKVFPSNSSGSSDIRSRFIEHQSLANSAIYQPQPRSHAQSQDRGGLGGAPSTTTPTPHNHGRTRSPSLGISYSTPTPRGDPGLSAPEMMYTLSTPVPLSNAQGYLDRPTSAMQHHDRGLTLPTPPPSAHGPPPPREQQYQQQQQQQSRVRSTSLSQQPYGTANTHRSTSTSRKPPPLIVSSRAPSSRHGANPGRAPAIVYAPSRNNMAMDEAYHPPEVMPRSAPAHQTTFPRGQIPPPQPIPLPGTGLPFPGETDQRHGDVPDTRSGRGRSHSRGRSKSRGRSSNESGVLVDSNGSSVVLVTPPSNHAVLVDSSSPSHHARHVTHHGHSHSYPQNSFGAPSPGRIHRPATSMGQHPAASSGGRSGSLVRALLPRSNSVTRMITGKRSKNRPTEEPQRGQVVHSRDLAAHGYANPRSRNTSTSSGSTYYVLPNPGQKVHVISTDDEASRYASTRSSGSSRYHRGTSSGQHSLLAIPPPQAPPGSPAVQSTKKPFFFNRLFGGMHLRDRSVDSARASSSRPRGERDKWSSGGGMVVTPALPPPQDTVQADASMFAADGRKMVMENPQDQAYGGSAGRSRGRKLLRRTSDQPPPMMHNYPAAT